MRPLAFAFCKLYEVCNSLRRFLVEQAANDLPLAGIERRVQPWLTCHDGSSLKLFCGRGGLLLRSRSRLSCRRLRSAFTCADDGDLVDLHRIEWPIAGSRPLVARHARDLLYQHNGC